MRAFVLDAQSSDATAEVAARCGAVVEERAWSNFVEARTYALSRVSTPWVLMLDADEALDARLRDAILTARGEVDGYVMTRHTYFAGKPLRMWRGEQLVRLFRANRAHLETEPVLGEGAALHERWRVDGATGTLDGAIHHASYVSRSDYMRKFERYTSIEAEHARIGTSGAIVQTVLAPARFLRLLAGKGALLDGLDGWFVAWYSAWYPAAVAWKARRRA